MVEFLTKENNSDPDMAQSHAWQTIHQVYV